jgi:hypothetical protein
LLGFFASESTIPRFSIFERIDLVALLAVTGHFVSRKLETVGSGSSVISEKKDFGDCQGA